MMNFVVAEIFTFTEQLRMTRLLSFVAARLVNCLCSAFLHLFDSDSRDRQEMRGKRVGEQHGPTDSTRRQLIRAHAPAWYAP